MIKKYIYLIDYIFPLIPLIIIIIMFALANNKKK